MDFPRWALRVGAAAADLALGGVCAGCGGAADLLCPACRRQLGARPRALRRRPGGVTVMASCVYGGPVRAAVLAHKEQGRLALSGPLGDVLARAVVQLLAASDLDHRPVALVPAPSARAVTRQRGHDPLLRITRRAAVVLRRDGLDCAVVPALRHRRRVSDQAGLGQIARLANLHGSMIVRSGAATLLTGRSVVIVDDVVTTGATIGEAVRAVRRSGHDPCGAAVIAAAP